MIELDEYQLDAVSKLKNGNILCGKTGRGKSRVALAYYLFKVCEGRMPLNGEGSFKPMIFPKDLYVITTPKKRDDGDWLEESIPFGLSNDPDKGLFHVAMHVDSWNNIAKYRKVFGAFFIFDEQRIAGSGAWVKAFLDISRKNQWILLSATPGDRWVDYVPVFVANGYFKNRTEFMALHAIINPYIKKYRSIMGYRDEHKLEKYRSDILVTMPVPPTAIEHHERIFVNYDKDKYATVWKKRWNPYEERPIRETSKLFYLLRRVVNDNVERIFEVDRIFKESGRVIIFYNFNYELEMIRTWVEDNDILFAEWNGFKHEPIPVGDSWVYAVQFNSGSEGWNCITAWTMIFFSQNYSYKMLEQACGRINRRDSPYRDLYFYHLLTHSPIDTAILKALGDKKTFNESSFKI